MALDLGCGYGRISAVLRDNAWDVVGFDPSFRVLSFAAKSSPEGMWCVGRLPDLPFAPATFDVVLAQSLLRVLHLNGVLQVARTSSIADILKPAGRLVVVDNIWKGNAKFVEEEWIIETYSALGLRLTNRVAIRNARWWGIYAVRYGLVPRTWFARFAEHELRIMSKRRNKPRFRYFNVMYIFEKPT
jgi:SAM-dependent methyltransferase